MALVKEHHAESPSPRRRLAPSRLLTPSGRQIGRLREGEVHDEQELLECIRELCREYGQRLTSPMTISSYQVLPPEAVSMLDPPERAWLVRLRLVGLAWDQKTGEIEIIAVLRGDEMQIILR